MEKIRVDFRDQISSNKRKSFFLIALIFAVIVLLGYVISLAYEPGAFFTIMILSIIISILYILFSYYNSDKVALLSVGAQEVGRTSHIYRQYHNLVEGLCLASGIKKPRLYVMKSEQINAFAAGRNPDHAVICVTEGALKRLEKIELEGVLAHEIGHIGNYDVRYMTLAAVMVGMISIISELFLRSLWLKGNNDDSKGNTVFILIGVVLAILAPIFVYFVQLAISRKREFSADATAIKFTRYPPGLISALEQIRDENKPEKKVSRAIAPLFFANPFVKELGSTHPPIEKRISALEKM